MNSKADSARTVSGDSKSRPSNVRLQGRTIFSLCVALGSLSIFLSEPVNAPFLVGVFIPILIMGAYLLIGLSGFADSVDTETFADSVYYMGFLLTLISLSAALFYLRNEDPSLNVLVAKFGLALITTIVGLTVRVAMVNFQMKGGQVRQHAEEKLAISVERFSNDLELTCDKMELLLHGVVEKVEITADAIKTASDDATATISETNRTNQNQLTEMYEKVGGEWGASVTRLTATMEKVISEAVTVAASQIAGLGRKFEDEMRKFNVDSDIFSEILDEPLNELAETIKTARVQLANEFALLQDASQGHAEIKDQFDKLSTTLTSGEQSVAALHSYAENLSGAFSSLSDLENSLTKLGGHSESVASNFESLADTAAKSSLSFSEDVESSKQSFLRLNQSLNALLHSVMKQSEEMGTLVTKISDDAEQGRSALRLVQDNLIESSEVIVKHLR
jgi:hypothetical protein